jgi:hypothetical protein
VDGFLAGLDCKTAMMRLDHVDPPAWRGMENSRRQMKVTLSSDDCVMPLYFYPTGLLNFARFQAGACNNKTDVESKRIGLIYGLMNISITSTNNGGGPVYSESMCVLKSTQLTCKPN